MLVLDNQRTGEVLGSIGTTGHPYWGTAERWRRWHRGVWWHNRHEILQRLFHNVAPQQHQVIKGCSCSEENVDDSTSLDYVAVVDIVDDIPSESSTTRCRQVVELLVFLRGSYIQKAQTTKFGLPTKFGRGSKLSCSLLVSELWVDTYIPVSVRAYIVVSQASYHSRP